MTTKELTLNERLAIAFGDFDSSADEHESFLHSNLFAWHSEPANYENDNLAAFALLEKAKRDGKIEGYIITNHPRRLVECEIWHNKGPIVQTSEKLSKAITQALAQLLEEETD